MEKFILNYWRYKVIPEVDYHLNRLECDKLTFNYLEYPEPYIQLDKFKEHIDNYDYIFIVTNDVIVKQENIDQLLKDIQDMSNPPAISAVMNVDLDKNSEMLNICNEIPEGDVYNWIHQDSVKGITEVKFAGFPLMAIRKDIFKRYEFTGSHFAGDRRFCKWCHDNGIKILANTDNQMLHLRYYGEKPTSKRQYVTWEKSVK